LITEERAVNTSGFELVGFKINIRVWELQFCSVTDRYSRCVQCVTERSDRYREAISVV